MRNLPKGFERLPKEKFVKEITAFLEGKEMIFRYPKQICIEWGEKTEKILTKKVFRW